MTGSMCSAAGLCGDPLPGCRFHNRAESRFRPALCPVRVFEKMQVVADQSLKLKDIIHFRRRRCPIAQRDLKTADQGLVHEVFCQSASDLSSKGKVLPHGLGNLAANCYNMFSTVSM